MNSSRCLAVVLLMMCTVGWAQTQIIPRESIQDRRALHHYFNDQMFSSQYSNSSNVLLARDNKLPFVKVTRGEYLDALGAAIERAYTAEKAKDLRDWSEGPARTKIQALTEARYQKRIAALQSARAAQGSRLSEPAEVATLQPGFMLENNPDVFGEGRGAGDRYPVYKVEPALAEQAKTGPPQWVVVTWDGNIATDPVAIQLQDAILNNFDFEYLYDFVFNLEKVKGRPYSPRGASPQGDSVMFQKP